MTPRSTPVSRPCAVVSPSFANRTFAPLAWPSCGRRGLRAQQARLPSPGHGLRARAGIKLAIDRLRLGLDRVHRDVETLGDLPEGAMAGEKPQDPELGNGQRRWARQRAFGQVVDLSPGLIEPALKDKG